MEQKTITGSVKATGQVISQPCVVTDLGILAGADAATVKIYDGNNALGALVFGLGAGTGLSASHTFDPGRRFKVGVYAVVTGTTPDVFVGIVSPQANQI